MRTENVELKEGFSKVFILLQNMVGHTNAARFEANVLQSFGVRCQYLEDLSIDTDNTTAEETANAIEKALKIMAAKDAGEPGSENLELPKIKGHNDVLFAIHDDDVDKYNLACLFMGMGLEGNGDIGLPLEAVLEYPEIKAKYPERIVGYLKK